MQQIEVNYHFVQEYVTQKKLFIGFINIGDQVVDILTKGFFVSDILLIIIRLQSVEEINAIFCIKSICMHCHVFTIYLSFN